MKNKTNTEIGLVDYKDKEIVIMTGFITSFLEKTDMTKTEAFNLGIFSSNLQYLSRLEKELKNNSLIHNEEDKSLYINQLEILINFPDLISHLKEKFVEWEELFKSTCPEEYWNFKTK